MQDAQKLRSEAHLGVRRSDEVAAQRCRWTFYEAIIINKKECWNPVQSAFIIQQSARKFSGVPLVVAAKVE